MSGREWHGLFNIDKPAGWMSRAVVDRVQRLVGRKVKIGHAGTLDPLATGVLVVCVGAATRLVDRIQEDAKGYRAGLRLGIRSDTDDLTGQIEAGHDPAGISAERLQEVCQEFVGSISQIPPKFSAVHVAGRRAYDLARTGQTFELTARTVQVYAAAVGDFQGADASVDIVCGSGTYVRSLIRDVGERLGCGAVMTSLRRTFIGPFAVEDALAGEDLTVDCLAEGLLPLKSAIGRSPVYAATGYECRALLQGRAILDRVAANGDAQERIAILDETGELFAFADRDAARGLLLPRQVFVR